MAVRPAAHDVAFAQAKPISGKVIFGAPKDGWPVTDQGTIEPAHVVDLVVNLDRFTAQGELKRSEGSGGRWPILIEENAQFFANGSPLGQPVQATLYEGDTTPAPGQIAHAYIDVPAGADSVRFWGVNPQDEEGQVKSAIWDSNFGQDTTRSVGKASGT